MRSHLRDLDSGLQFAPYFIYRSLHVLYQTYITTCIYMYILTNTYTMQSPAKVPTVRERFARFANLIFAKANGTVV